MKFGENSSKKNVSQRDLKPLEINGVTAVTIGTILWLISLISLLMARSFLINNGRTNWIWIAASGLALGLLGIRYVTNRVNRINKLKELDQQKLIHDFE